MIKVYRITSKGKSFIKGRGLPELQGIERKELRACLTMFYKEYSVKDTFCFDTSPETSDHSYTQHIKLLEKAGCIIRNREGEEEIKEFLKSLPPETEPSWAEILESLA